MMDDCLKLVFKQLFTFLKCEKHLKPMLPPASRNWQLMNLKSLCIFARISLAGGNISPRCLQLSIKANTEMPMNAMNLDVLCKIKH